MCALPRGLAHDLLARSGPGDATNFTQEQVKGSDAAGWLRAKIGELEGRATWLSGRGMDVFFCLLQSTKWKAYKVPSDNLYYYRHQRKGFVRHPDRFRRVVDWDCEAGTGI